VVGAGRPRGGPRRESLPSGRYVRRGGTVLEASEPGNAPGPSQDEAKKSLAFDNMQSRPVKGTRDWQRYEVVLDVAPEAKKIAMGVLLDGEGTLWVSDMNLEVVPTSVPTTDMMTDQKRGPENLRFQR
jgi:hypothetical protein